MKRWQPGCHQRTGFCSCCHAQVNESICKSIMPAPRQKTCGRRSADRLPRPRLALQVTAREREGTGTSRNLLQLHHPLRTTRAWFPAHARGSEQITDCPKREPVRNAKPALPGKPPCVLSGAPWKSKRRARCRLVQSKASPENGSRHLGWGGGSFHSFL